MEFAKLKNGITLHYKEINKEKKDSVVFINAVFQVVSTWESIVNKHFNDFHVILYNLQGQQFSSPLKEPKALRQDAEELKMLLDHLGLEKSNVFGFCGGALIAELLAINYPEKIEKLVLGGASCVMSARRRVIMDGYINTLEHQDMADFVTITAPHVFGEKFIEGNLDAIDKAGRIMKIVLNKEGIINIIKTLQMFKDDLSGDLRKFEKPVLLLKGEADTYSSFADAQYLCNSLKNSLMIVYKDAGHAMYADYPRETWQDMVAFLKGNKVEKRDTITFYYPENRN